MAKLAEKTYGDALFELAEESGQIELLFDEAKSLKSIFGDNAELAQLLNHPKISKEEKQKVVENIFKGHISDDMMGFVLLMIRKDRQKQLVKTLEYFTARVKEYKKIGAATVKTASEMSPEQRKAIEAKLISTTEYESFEMEYIVDKNLIGGMIIRIGDKVIDSSIKSQIEKMSRELYKIRLS